MKYPPYKPRENLPDKLTITRPQHRPDLIAARAIDVACATAHDAVTALERAGVTDGQLRLVRAAAHVLETARDHDAAADYGGVATGHHLIALLIGHTEEGSV